MLFMFLLGTNIYIKKILDYSKSYENIFKATIFILYDEYILSLNIAY